MPDIWYQVRKKVGDIRNTMPQGIVGPGFNDEFGDTYGIVYGFTADGFTQRELRDYVDDIRKQLLQLPDISKIDVLGAQDERVYVEFSTAQLAGLGIDRTALIAALQAQNAVTPAGVMQTADEKILVRVSGAFRSEQDILKVNFVANGRIIRLATSPMSRAVPPIRRSRCSASMDATASASPSPCARAATCWRSGAMSSTPWRRSRRICQSESSRRSLPTSR